MSPFRHHVAATLLTVAATVVPVWANAGTTGKVTGRVADAQGNPLAGANVILIGVRLGAVTDDIGTYVILNVPPGTYDLKVSLIGHASVTVKGLVVSADRTTRNDITLREEAVGLQEIVVTARRPVVESDLTSTRYIVRSEEIEKLPVQELQEVVNLQAGVVDGHIRGGRHGEVQFQVDGVTVNNAYDNSAGVRIDRALIEEVQVISGTFDAEYGQALSGVVNAVLKSGGDSLEWSAEAYAGDFMFDGGGARIVADNFRPAGVYQFVASLTGPIPFPATTFVLSGRRYVFDDYVRTNQLFVPTDRPDLTGIASGDGSSEALGFTREWSGLAKLTNKSWPSVTVSYQALFNSIRHRNSDFAWRLNPDGLSIQRTMNFVHGLDWSQRLSKNMFYTIAARQNVVDYTDWVYEDPFDPRYDAAGAPKGVAGFENGAIFRGVSLSRFEQNTNALVLKGSLSSQAHRFHLVKVGGELMRPRVRFGSPTTIIAATGTDGSETLVRHGHEPPNFFGVQSYRPVFAAAYAQDQIEWRDLTVRAGLRYEFFDARSVIPSDLANPANAIAGAPESRPKDTSNKMSLAPRIGVSYPVGARAAVFFSYGHFYQLPGMHLLFENANYDVLADLQSGLNFAIMGNPDLEPEHTVQYEFGYKHAITPDLGVDLTVFYKDIRDLLGVEFVSTYAAGEYARFTNVDFGNVLGLTLALDQRTIGPFSATVDYTWQMAQGNASDPRETATRAEAGEDPRPRLIPLNWDQKHTLNLTLTLADPLRYSASAIVRSVSGQPYTPTITTGFGGGLEANSGRKPNGLMVDLRGERWLPVMRNVSVFGRVFNLFDARVFNGFVFNDTGSPDYTRTPETSQAKLADPTRFYAPRRVEIGISASGILGGGGSR